jgi:hypothetical protein
MKWIGWVRAPQTEPLDLPKVQQGRHPWVRVSNQRWQAVVEADTEDAAWAALERFKGDRCVLRDGDHANLYPMAWRLAREGHKPWKPRDVRQPDERPPDMHERDNRPPTRPSTGRRKTLWVGGLNFASTANDVLTWLAGDEGGVLAVRLVTDAKTGASRGYAFADVASERVEQILQLSGTTFHGRKIIVRIADNR